MQAPLLEPSAKESESAGSDTFVVATAATICVPLRGADLDADGRCDIGALPGINNDRY